MAIITGKIRKQKLKKKAEKKPRGTGQLSEAEKLASQNPAQRREAQRKGQSPEDITKAREIAGRGFAGTVRPELVPTSSLPGEGGRFPEQQAPLQEQPSFLQEQGITSPESTLPFGITPKTSVAIGIAGAAALGAGAFLTSFGVRTVATRGLSSTAISKLASGGESRKFVFEKAGEYARGTSGYVKYPLNTKTARSTVNYVTKLVSGSKFVTILLGFGLGSIPFLATQSFNDRTDSTFTWTQAAEEALERGDIEAAKEYRDLLAEVNEMNQNLISIDNLNYPKSTVIKVKSGLDLIDERIKNAELEAEKEAESASQEEKFHKALTKPHEARGLKEEEEEEEGLLKKTAKGAAKIADVASSIPGLGIVTGLPSTKITKGISTVASVVKKGDLAKQLKNVAPGLKLDISAAAKAAVKAFANKKFPRIGKGAEQPAGQALKRLRSQQTPEAFVFAKKAAEVELLSLGPDAAPGLTPKEAKALVEMAARIATGAPR